MATTKFYIPIIINGINRKLTVEEMCNVRETIANYLLYDAENIYDYLFDDIGQLVDDDSDFSFDIDTAIFIMDEDK